ncbi:hypothetical protein FQR65_LT00072 [Abscondita terminalis]|nr:hypothetical protein FQR65_LT00072 [Abscondita terminalis]
MECPMALPYRCQWQGTVSELYEHIKGQHPQNAIELNKGPATLRVNTRIVSSAYSQIVLKAHGSEKNATHFYGIVEFRDPIEPNSSVRMQSKCHILGDYIFGTKMPSESFSDKEFIQKLVTAEDYYYVLHIKSKNDVSEK